ncbi:acetyltransferase [Gordonia metallireducens]|uniref:acetyltransferase n=1 Tax=Gordonia metallireducens TaxID=2897779 RepID=UPI001E588812|nr:acetyltransferase [Gordonia metallireducens]
MTSPVTLRACHGPDEYPHLVAIWRSAVNATHDFLAEHDRNEIERQLAPSYFPQVELTVADVDGGPVGFAGTAGSGLEMLFIEADARGTGVGTALLTRVLEDGVTTVDVNEQNDQAVQFYLRRGFEVTGRSELDDAGRPYPLLHMTLRAAVS